MGTRRVKVIGVAAAALAVTACGIAASHSGGIPGGHPAPASARHAPVATVISEQEALARFKGHLTWSSGDPGVQRPQADTSSVSYQSDLARFRYMAFRAEQARNR